MIDVEEVVAVAESFNTVSEARKWIITIVGDLTDLWLSPGGKHDCTRLLLRIVEPFKGKGKGDFLKEIEGYIKSEINKRRQEKFEEATSDGQRETFDTESNGSVLATQRNIVKILSNNKFIEFNYENFTDRKIFRFTNGDLWNDGLDKSKLEIKYPVAHNVSRTTVNTWYYVSGHLPELKLYLHQFFTDERRWYELDDAIDVVCKRNQFNIYQDWMNNGLPEWDGKNRFDFLYRHAGADNREWSKVIGKLLILGMVARCYEPGFDFRGTVILEGDENIGKSWLSASLAFDDRFATTYEFNRNSNDYEAARQIKGQVIIELADKGGIDSKTPDQIKAFLTKRHDVNRKMQTDDVEHNKRSGIFVITCNESGAYLKGGSPTGDTRFYPIRCNGKMNVEAIIAELPQLYSQAKSMWLSGITPRPTEEEMAYQRENISSRQVKPDYYYRLLEALKITRKENGEREVIGPDWDQGITMQELFAWMRDEPWFNSKSEWHHGREMAKILKTHFHLKSDIEAVPTEHQEQRKAKTLRAWRYYEKVNGMEWTQFLDSLKDVEDV